MSQIRLLEDDEAESEQDNITNRLSSNSADQQKMVSISAEELRMMLTRTVDRRLRELLGQNLGPLMSRIVRQNLGPLLSRIKQIESAHEKCFASLSQYDKLIRNSASGSNSTRPRSFQLQFLNKLSLPILSGVLIKAEGPSPINVAIVDDSTQEVVKCGPEASAKVEIVAVEGVFDGNVRRSCWSLEGLRSYIVKQKDGKKSRLKGQVHLTLKEGIGFVGDIYLMHGQDWMRKRELKLVAIAVDKLYGTTVAGAMTESFEIKDKRLSHKKKKKRINASITGRETRYFYRIL